MCWDVLITPFSYSFEILHNMTIFVPSNVFAYFTGTSRLYLEVKYSLPTKALTDCGICENQSNICCCRATVS